MPLFAAATNTRLPLNFENKTRWPRKQKFRNYSPTSDKTERQSAQMSKITNDGLTWSGTKCFIAVSIWQQ